MRRDQREQAIRTACQIIGGDEVIVVGSQSILGTYEPAATISRDDHVAAGLGSPAACRNVLRQLRARADDGELDATKRSSVSDELERLRTPPGRRPDAWFSSR